MQLAATSDAPKEKTLVDLSDADLALVYQQVTGAELASGFISGSDLASSVNILLKNGKISPDQIAKNWSILAGRTLRKSCCRRRELIQQPTSNSSWAICFWSPAMEPKRLMRILKPIVSPHAL